MGWKTFRSEEQINRLFEEYKEITGNYKLFSEGLFVEHPQLLLIVRLACGMAQREFAKTIGCDRSALVHSELLISKSMKKSNAKNLYPKLQKLIAHADFSEENIINNYRNFLHSASRGQSPEQLRKFARLGMKNRKFTAQELKISKILENFKIKYEKEGILVLDGMEFYFEFLIPDAKNPKIIIECKRAEAKDKRNLRIIGYRIAYETGYKAQLIRRNFPNIKIVVIVEHNQETLPERVKKILKNETDLLLINPKENELYSELKTCLGLG